MKVINTQNVEHYNDMYIKATMANNQVDEDRGKVSKFCNEQTK